MFMYCEPEEARSQDSADGTANPARGRRGRPPTLTPAKRQTIISLLCNGSTRRVAARFVGCATSTITRTAAADPEFAADLARAEQTVEIEALRNIRVAAKTGKYWRASAWLLERKNPYDFADRPLAHYTGRDVMQTVLEIATWLCNSVPEPYRKVVLRQLDRMVRDFEQDAQSERRLLKDLGFPPPRPWPPGAQQDSSAMCGDNPPANDFCSAPPLKGDDSCVEFV
jgi:hypothetical protein